MSWPISRYEIWTREPAEVPNDFLHRIPMISSPFSTITCKMRRMRTNFLLHKNYIHILAALLYLSVSRGDVFVRAAVLFIGVSAVCADGINVPRDDQAEDLFASPERSRLQDSRLGHFAVPCGEKHEEVHNLTLKQSTHNNLLVPAQPNCSSHSILSHSFVYVPSLRRHLSW